ncbi:Ankyrin repeat domain-containing protein 50-like protein 3 [Seiridium cupressi]
MAPNNRPYSSCTPTQTNHERINGASSERPSPYGVNERGALETVDNVILFGSEVQCYWENESAGRYAAEISKRYNKAKERNLSREERNAHIWEFVDSQVGEANQSWFHHVLTELAFLDLRASGDLEHHGIIPFALDGRLLTYLPYIKHSDVHLKTGVVSDKPSFLHRTYFRLLKHIYTKAHFVIEDYESCYTASKVRLGQEGGTITRETLSNIVFEKTSEANIMHRLDIGVRDALKLQEFDKRVNDEHAGNRHSMPSSTNLHHPAFLSGAVISKFEKSGSTDNSREELWDIFKEVTRSTSKQPMICVLDALDECEENGRYWLMKKVEAIFNDKSTSSSFTLLLTSRPAVDLDQFSRDWQSLSFIIHLNGSNYGEAAKISTEVQHVIAKGVETLCRKLQLRQHDEKDLVESLTKFEDRTYLWVTLVFQVLNKGSYRTKREIEAAIQNSSPTVNATYEHILNRYSSKHGSEKVRSLLHIVLGVHYPMNLQKMSVALAISLWDPSEGPPEPEPEEWIEEMLNGLREFLVQTSPSSLPSPSQNKSVWQESFRIEESQRILAEVCLSILDQYYSEGLAMKGYAVENWVSHFRKSHTNDIRMKTRARDLCDPSSISFPRWYGDAYKLLKKSHFRDEGGLPTSPTTALMVASPLGLKVVVDLLLSEERPDLHSKDNWHQPTAFGWACRNGRKDVVESFFLYIANFSESPDVNDTLKDNILETRDGYGRTPLNHATSRNHLAVVRLLLSQGASPNSRDKSAHNVLHNAIRQGAKNMVRTLSESTARLEDRTDRGLTALLLAASFDRAKRMIPILLEKGADVTASGSDGETALYHIASQKWPAGIELLLRYEADVDSQDEQGLRLLHIAARLSDADAVGVLLKHGATIDAQDKNGRTLLHIILGSEDPKARVTKILLGNKALVNVQDNSGRTPLRIALETEKPNVYVIEALISYDALVDPQNTLGRAPLGIAVEENAEHVLSMPSPGALVDTRDEDGRIQRHSEA